MHPHAHPGTQAPVAFGLTTGLATPWTTRPALHCIRPLPVPTTPLTPLARAQGNCLYPHMSAAGSSEALAAAMKDRAAGGWQALVGCGALPRAQHGSTTAAWQHTAPYVSAPYVWLRLAALATPCYEPAGMSTYTSTCNVGPAQHGPNC